MNSSEIVQRLRGACVDWDGSEAQNGAEPIHPTSCGDLRRAADHIEAQDKLIAEMRAYVEYVDKAARAPFYLKMNAERILALSRLTHNS